MNIKKGVTLHKKSLTTREQACVILSELEAMDTYCIFPSIRERKYLVGVVRGIAYAAARLVFLYRHLDYRTLPEGVSLRAVAEYEIEVSRDQLRKKMMPLFEKRCIESPAEFFEAWRQIPRLPGLSTEQRQSIMHVPFDATCQTTRLAGLSSEQQKQLLPYQYERASLNFINKCAKLVESEKAEDIELLATRFMWLLYAMESRLLLEKQNKSGRPPIDSISNIFAGKESIVGFICRVAREEKLSVVEVKRSRREHKLVYVNWDTDPERAEGNLRKRLEKAIASPDERVGKAINKLGKRLENTLKGRVKKSRTKSI
jgi:hypothetical protein